MVILSDKNHIDDTYRSGNSIFAIEIQHKFDFLNPYLFFSTQRMSCELQRVER